MNIRKATLKDIKEIENIVVQSSKMHYEARKDIFKKELVTQGEKKVKKAIKDKETNLLVAEEDGTIKGVVIYQIKKVKGNQNLLDSKVVWISEICVDEDYRGQGIGTKLIDHLKQLCKEQGIKRLELNCWEFNEKARKFYEENEFTTQRRIMEIKL